MEDYRKWELEEKPITVKEVKAIIKKLIKDDGGVYGNFERSLKGSRPVWRPKNR